MKTKRLAGAIGASLALLLTSCGSDEKSASPATAAAPKSTSATAATPGATDVAEATTPTTAASKNTTASEDTTAPQDSSATEDTIHSMSPAEMAAAAKAEGELNIIVWAGYAEDGSTDPAVDWVTPFEDETGCAVNVKVGNSSDEMVTLMQSGEYDGVSASGDATTRLIDGGDVAPVDLTQVPNYADVFDGLKMKPWNSKDGKAYGIPHGRGANLLVYNTEAFPTAPDSWSAMFETNSAAAGAISVYDSPIYIADAAIYLMSTKPALKITNPYALDQTQFDAAIALLQQQKGIASQYWATTTDQATALEDGSVTAGTTWQYTVSLALGNGAKIAAIKAKEGATGWSDTWMVSSKAKHPSCMYLWMNHIVSPKVNAQVAEWFGEAPSNAKACALASAGFCGSYHAQDDGYWDDVWYWTTATETCLDGRTDAKCIPYSDWVTAWSKLRA